MTHSYPLPEVALKAILALPFCVGFAIPVGAEEQFALALPINCKLSVTCFVQNYMDHDTSEKINDFRCGGRTYNSHTGTDFRIPDLEIQRKGVEVLSAAAGRVARVRDGIEDISVRIAGKNAIAGKECGNGAVVEHEQGWTTQYCHMAKGSLRVKPGDRVAAGQPIGLVGLSGDTEFPHVHFTVRHNGNVVDPFAYEASRNSCNGGRSIWAAALLPQMTYRAREILNFGFSAIPVTMDLIERGDVKIQAVKPGSDTLVAYIRAVGLQAGDEQTLTVYTPDDKAFAEYRAPALESNKAQFFVSAGRKRKDVPWPLGTYKATYLVKNDGIEVMQTVFEFQIKEQ